MGFSHQRLIDTWQILEGCVGFPENPPRKMRRRRFRLQPLCLHALTSQDQILWNTSIESKVHGDETICLGSLQRWLPMYRPHSPEHVTIVFHVTMTGRNQHEAMYRASHYSKISTHAKGAQIVQSKLQFSGADPIIHWLTHLWREGLVVSSRLRPLKQSQMGFFFRPSNTRPGGQRSDFWQSSSNLVINSLSPVTWGFCGSPNCPWDRGSQNNLGCLCFHPSGLGCWACHHKQGALKRPAPCSVGPSHLAGGISCGLKGLMGWWRAGLHAIIWHGTMPNRFVFSPPRGPTHWFLTQL